MLDAVRLATGKDPSHAVIWLHGLGADGHDFVPLAELPAFAEIPIAFVFPHAPRRAVTINSGMVMRAWYDIRGADLAAREDADGLAASATEVEEIIADLGTRGFAASQIILAGFSQGGALALHLGLRRQQAFAGLIALSAYLPLARDFPAALSEAGKATPVFMGHGRNDPVVPFEFGSSTAEALQSWGMAVQFHGYAMAHQVNPEEIEDVRSFVHEVFRADA